MANNKTHASVRIVFHDGQPYIESRLRAVDPEQHEFIPKGKIFVHRTPLLSSGTSKDETEILDDEGSGHAFCPECAAAGMPPGMFGGGPRAGRNDPCPCGSGRKYKRCCLN